MALVCVIGLHSNALFFRSLGGWDDGSFRASVCVLASPIIFAVTVGTAPCKTLLELTVGWAAGVLARDTTFAMTGVESFLKEGGPEEEAGAVERFAVLFGGGGSGALC